MFGKIALIDKFVILLNMCAEHVSIFELLIKRVCHVMSHDEEFNVHEKSKLTTALSLDANETDLIISTMISILRECVYYVAKPNLVFQVRNKM